METIMRNAYHKIFLTVASLCLSSTLAFADGDTIEKSFPVTPGGTLQVEADLGSLEIRAIEGSEIKVEVERTTDGDASMADKLLKDLQTQFTPNAKGLRIKSTYAHEVPGDSSKLPLWAKFRISVPQHYNLDLNTGRGNIVVKGITGSLSAETLGGNVEIEDVLGKVVATTAGGHVNVSLSTQPTDSYRLVTSGGHMNLYLAAGVAINVDAVTGGGHVTSELDPTVKSSLGASLRQEINGGGPRIVLRSGGGNIGIFRLGVAAGR